MDQFERSLRSALASALLLVVGTLSESVKAEEDYRFTNDVVLTDVRVSLVETRAPDWKSDSQGFVLVRSVIHVWTAPVGQGEIDSVLLGGSGSFMCSACSRGATGRWP